MYVCIHIRIHSHTYIHMCVYVYVLHIHMGGCQNYGPFLGTLNNRCRIIVGTQKKAIILTTTHMQVYVCVYIYIHTHTHRLPCGPVWSNMKHPNPRFSLEAPKETSDLGSAPWKFNTAR